MKTKTFFLLFFLSAAMLYAQPYKIKRLGIEQGISSNYVMSIAQDDYGFLWVATESGLNRFDGNGFKVYKKNGYGNKTISGNELNKVYADKFDNTIWVATQREGLNAFDYATETFTYYKYSADNPSGIITNDITDITNASDGNLWVSTYYKGVEYFDKKSKKFTHYNKSTIPDLVSDNVWAIKEDNKGLLYIGHVSSGLSILSLKDNNVINFKNDPNNPQSLPGNEVRTIYVDKSDNVWVGTNNGLALFNADKKTFTVFRHNPNNPESLIANSIYSIIQLNDGRLWVGAEIGGVSILDIRKSMFSSPQNIPFVNISYREDESGFSNQTIRSIFQDSFENIWVGTYGGGVNFISCCKPFFNYWEYSPIPGIINSLNDKTAWGVCADNQNNLWVGTDGGGINLFVDGKKNAVYKKENANITDNAILAALKDSQGNLWFGTFNGGVNVYDARKKTFSQLKLNDGSKEIRCFYEDNEQNMWIGSSGGLYIYNLLSGQTKLYTTKNSELDEQLARSISKDRNGNIWVGFFGQGLSVFDANFKRIAYFKTENGFPSNTINHIYQDASGQMWVATGEGLVCFAASPSVPSKYLIYNEQNGLANNHIRAIAEDELKNIWISTNGGISRYIPMQKKFYNYNHFDGIPIGDFMSGSVTKTTDGTIFFGSQNGLCFFTPTLVPTEIHLSPTVITEFRIYDNKIELLDNEINTFAKSVVKLAHNQNTFSVYFNVLDYSTNHLVEHAYMLSGLEKSWYNIQGENSITFRNIPPGTYELKIKSRIKNQEWSENITSLQIVIRQPFWFTWWAKSIYVIAVLAIIFFIFRFYKRRFNLENTLMLEKKKYQQEQDLNNERLRFFTNITHELRTPLTLILGPLEDLTSDNSLSKKHADKISVIHKSATRLLNLINQLLEFRKTETQNKKLCVSKNNLAELVREVGMKYKELNTNKAIAFHILIETQNPFVYFDSDIITSIVDNLLSNAFKYTEKGTIKLILRDVTEQQLDYTEIEVIDTGRGIPAASLPKIFDRYYQAEKKFQASGTGIGLALVKNLVEIHQGAIFVDSEHEKGTSFRFRILAANTYPDALHSDVKSENKATSEKEEQIELSDGKQIVLVVEDNEEIRNYIMESLSERYKVFMAENGKKGLEEAYAHIPDIIVSDIMMPEMDGFELSKILKEDVRTSHIPIILLTAKDTIQDRTEGYSLGVESYITKPFSASLLQSRIVNLMEARQKIAKLINNNTANKNAQMIESLNKLDNEFIGKITAIVEQNLDSEDIDVDFIADKMFMSHSTLYRKIKALSGLSANEFIRKVRIRNAEQLLLTGKYSISEVSYMVGINSITYFRQCFKEEFGLVPSEYIKQIKGDGK